jgi:ABC-type nitrate/sulfonate/bicarbonate transport system substrate-binding protein
MLWRKTCLAILVTILAADCQPGVSQGAALEKVTVSYGSISGTQSPVWVAKEKGVFEKHGLDASLIYISGGPRSVMALLGGSVQFVVHSAMPSLEAYLGGADTVLVGTSMNHLDHYLVVHPSITTPRELRGKVIGVSALGSLTDTALREALRVNELSERDVTILAVGDLGARMVGLQNGTIQGTLLIGAQAVAAARMGFKLLIDFSKLPFEVATSSILSRRAYLQKNRDTAMKFMKAWVEATYLFKSNREAGVAIMKKYTRTDDAEILATIYSRYRNLVASKPDPSVETVKSMVRLLPRARSGANADGFIEPRFVRELEAARYFEEMSKQYPAARN